jgi:hypothetical protein
MNWAKLLIFLIAVPCFTLAQKAKIKSFTANHWVTITSKGKVTHDSNKWSGTFDTNGNLTEGSDPKYTIYFPETKNFRIDSTGKLYHYYFIKTWLYDAKRDSQKYEVYDRFFKDSAVGYNLNGKGDTIAIHARYFKNGKYRSFKEWEYDNHRLTEIIRGGLKRDNFLSKKIEELKRTSDSANKIITKESYNKIFRTTKIKTIDYEGGKLYTITYAIEKCNSQNQLIKCISKIKYIAEKTKRKIISKYTYNQNGNIIMDYQDYGEMIYKTIYNYKYF